MGKQVPYAKNFFTLGSEEMRDVPRTFGIHALQLLASSPPSFESKTLSSSTTTTRRGGVPTVMLYCKEDYKWAPAEFHVNEIQNLKETLVPNYARNNIHIKILPNMQHAFMIEPEMTNRVTAFCINTITNYYERNQTQQQHKMRSKL